MNLTNLNPNYDPNTVRDERNASRRRKVFGTLAGVAVAGLLGAGLEQAANSDRPEPLPRPTGQNVIAIEARPNDTPGKLAQHFKSRDGKGRLDVLSNLFVEEAKAQSDTQDPNVMPGQTFVVDGDIFEPNPDNPPELYVEVPPVEQNPTTTQPQ